LLPLYLSDPAVSGSADSSHYQGCDPGTDESAAGSGVSGKSGSGGGTLQQTGAQGGGGGTGDGKAEEGRRYESACGRRVGRSEQRRHGPANLRGSAPYWGRTGVRRRHVGP